MDGRLGVQRVGQQRSATPGAPQGGEAALYDITGARATHLRTPLIPCTAAPFVLKEFSPVDRGGVLKLDEDVGADSVPHGQVARCAWRWRARV